jgi:hypothetical protein
MMRWAKYVAQIGKQETYQVSVRKSEGKIVCNRQARTVRSGNEKMIWFCKTTTASINRQRRPPVFLGWDK